MTRNRRIQDRLQPARSEGRPDAAQSGLTIPSQIPLGVCLLVALAVTLPVGAQAEVASVDLTEMLSRAAFVGVVHDDRVSDLGTPSRGTSAILEFLAQKYPSFPWFWRRTAEAKVREIWKGKAQGRVYYRAFPLWACDVSRAVVGADVVIFLDKVFPSSFEIAWEGYGRFQIVPVGQDICVEVGDALLPAALTGRLRSSNSPRARLLLLNDLRAWVRGSHR